jgi:hypothetical protein
MLQFFGADPDPGFSALLSLDPGLKKHPGFATLALKYYSAHLTLCCSSRVWLSCSVMRSNEAMTLPTTPDQKVGNAEITCCLVTQISQEKL